MDYERVFIYVFVGFDTGSGTVGEAVSGVGGGGEGEVGGGGGYSSTGTACRILRENLLDVIIAQSSLTVSSVPFRFDQPAQAQSSILSIFSHDCRPLV